MTTEGWLNMGRCANCYEPLETDGLRWRHSHADKDVYCGTGDGAMATASDCAACGAEAYEPCRWPCTAHAEALELEAE